MAKGNAVSISNERFAENLRVIMARRRSSAADVCRATGIRQATFSEHMSGKHEFPIVEIEAIIVRYLGWDLDNPETWARLLRPADDTELAS